MLETIIQENMEDIDLLDRQAFVDQVVNIIEKQAVLRKNVCFAINGRWGVGKSFVLKMIENTIKETQQGGVISDKYLLFHYDCWKYDYYEEPIIAIVASMLDELDENVNLLTRDKVDTIKSILKEVGKSLLSNTNDKIKEVLNVDVKEIAEIINNGLSESKKQVESNHQYDTYFAFKEILLYFQETVKTLSDNQTVIMIVDELDRCLPEYMIKVLERLHHVFSDIPNVQVIISMDKEQIKHTVQQIYGMHTDVNKYLAKFMSFEMNLDNGDLNVEYENRFSYYFNKFESQNDATAEFDMGDFKNILEGIDMRGKIEIINKCNLLHEILCTKEKVDYSFMCIEMFFAVVKYWNVDMTLSYSDFDKEKPFKYKNDDRIYTGLEYFISRCGFENQYFGDIYFQQQGIEYVRRDTIWTVLIASFRYILGFTRDKYMKDSYKGQGLRNYSHELWNLLHIIN